LTNDGRVIIMYNLPPQETKEPAPVGNEKVTGGLKAAMLRVEWLYGK
jgi:hypothetical protein